MYFNFLLKNTRCLMLALAAIFVLSSFQTAAAQSGYDRIEKERMKSVLNNIKKDIKKNYYDSSFHGIDIEERFKKAEERLDTATSVGQAFSVIAQALIDFNDSHLFFLPPQTNVEVEYGFRMKMVGDKTFVSAVKPKSDAEAKGLKIGDQILLFEGFRPTRKDLWKMNYYYYLLSPKTKLRLNILHPNASEPQEMTIDSKVTEQKRVLNINDSTDFNDLVRQSSGNRKISYLQKVGNTVVWKLLTFSFDPLKVDDIMREVKTGNNLILDLRGNGGGYIKTLERLTGYFFENDIKIADRKGREGSKKESEPMMAKSRGADVYKGKLVVLIDAESGSASEIFARLVQLEKRGTVIGDVSAGAVMQSVRISGTVGADRQIFYGTSVTNADVIMSDGKSLEHIGVKPDELIIPTAEGLAKRSDAVLAFALGILGNSITPESAGKIIPDDEWDNK